MAIQSYKTDNAVLVRTWKNPISRSLEHEKGASKSVELYYEKGGFCALVCIDNRISEVCQNKIKNIPQIPSKLSLDSLTALFKKYTPKVIKELDGTFSIKFICASEGMFIFIKTTTGATVSLQVNPTDRFERVWQLMKEKGILLKDYTTIKSDDEIQWWDRLIYCGKTYHHDTEYSLLEAEVTTECTLHYCGYLSGGGPMPSSMTGTLDAVEFNKLERIKKIDFSPNAPDHRAITKGLNLKGKCLTKGCTASDEIVYIKNGIGKFELAHLKYSSICPGSCKQPISPEEISNLGFYDCQYKIDGFLIEPEKKRVEGEWKIADNKGFTTFNSEDDGAKWGYITITTEPRK